MDLEQRRAAFAALLNCYTNDFSNVREGATRHCAAFVSKALLSEAGRQALKLDPRLTSTDHGAVAVQIAKQILTHERASRAFIDVEISEGAMLVTFDRTLHPDAATSLLSNIGSAAVLAKVDDKIGEGLVSDILLLAVEPTQQVVEQAIVDVKCLLAEAEERKHLLTRTDDEGKPEFYIHGAGPMSGPSITKDKSKASRLVHGHAQDLAKQDGINFGKGAKVGGWRVAEDVSEAKVGPIDRPVFHKAEKAAIDQYGASTREKDPRKFYSITMAIYKKMKGVEEGAVTERDDEDAPGYAKHEIRVDNLKPEDREHLASLLKKHGGFHQSDRKHATSADTVMPVSLKKEHEKAFASDWNAHLSGKPHATLGNHVIPESVNEAGLHHEVSKSLAAAGMNGSKLFAAPGEGWSALHSALAKHGLVIHPTPTDHGTNHNQSHQLARPSANAGHEPEPIEGAYLAVQRTAGVGDREGVSGTDMPEKGRHEFNTYLTGKKLKESTVTESFKIPHYEGEKEVTIHSFGNNLAGKSGVQGSVTGKYTHAALAQRHANTVSRAKTDKDYPTKSVKYTIDGKDHHHVVESEEVDSTKATNESALMALPKSDLTAIHTFVHEGKVDEFAPEANRSTVSFHSPVKDGEIKNLHAALGGTEAFSKLVGGSSHDLVKGNHKFSAYGPDHKEKAEKFAQLVKANIGVEPSIEHKSHRLGESAITDKMRAILRMMVLPGQRTVKEANSFDTALAKALKVTRANWRPATYGMVAESDEKFAEIVDDVCEALASEVPAEEMERRFIEEGFAITGETLCESVTKNAPVFASHLQAITRATLLGNGFGSPAVHAALERWATTQE